MNPAADPQANCPLCHSNWLSVLQRIPARMLCRGYRKVYGLGVESLFAQAPTIEFRECGACGLRFFTPPVCGDGPFYEQLQRFEWYYRKDKAEYEIAREYIQPAQRVLDVGCGIGDFSACLPQVEYVGLELNANAVRAGRAAGRDIRPESVEEHSAHASAYDVVASFQVLEHVPRPREFLEGQLAVLRPGGLLMVCVPNDDSYVGYRRNSLLNAPPHHASRWTEAALQSIARILKLELVALRRERMSALHAREFQATLLEATLSRSLSKTPIFDLSLRGRLVAKVASRLARRAPILEADGLLPAGHSVLAVFRK